MDVRVGLGRRLSAEELMLLNCGVEKTLESPLDCKEIQQVHSMGDQPWMFFGKNDAKVETPVLWPPHAMSWLIGKDSDAGRDWGQEEKGTTEDEMAGWHHWLDGRESEWTLGVGDGQGGLACCDSWGRKESDMTERLNWLKVILGLSFYETKVTYSFFYWTLNYLFTCPHHQSWIIVDELPKFWVATSFQESIALLSDYGILWRTSVSGHSLRAPPVHLEMAIIYNI